MPVLIGAMAAGLPWGIFGVAVGYAIASFSLFYYTALTAFRVIALRLVDFHRVLVWPLVATLIMVGVLEAAAASMQSLAPALRLSLGIAMGVLTYGAASLAVNRAQLVEVLSVLRSLRHNH